MTMLRAFIRLPVIGWVLGRAGVLGHLARLPLLPSWMARSFGVLNKLIAGRNAHEDAGQALCDALQRLGPAFIKFGQALSTRADLLGPDIAGALVKLQDQVPAFDGKLARQILAQELGQPVETYFKDFDPNPVAAASVAQVHKGQLQNGQMVAVKILRPDIRRRMSRDIAFFEAMAQLVERLAPALRRLRLIEAVAQFKQWSDIELDMQMEAAAGGRLGDNLAGDEGVRIPWIDIENSTQNILISEWIDGVRIDDIGALAAAGHDISALTERAASSFFAQVFRDGYFHADMHPGNIFVTADGTLVPIDFGIMGHLSLSDRLFLAQLLIALLDRDYDRVAELHQEAGMLHDGVPLELFSQNLRAVVEPVLNKPLGEIELGTALGQILQLSARFDIAVQPQFTLLQKTLGMAEGVARHLSPNANMWALAGPHAQDWMAGQTGLLWRAEQFRQDIRKLVTAVPEIVELLQAQAHSSSAQHKNTPFQHKTGWFWIFLSGLLLGLIGAVWIEISYLSALILDFIHNIF